MRAYWIHEWLDTAMTGYTYHLRYMCKFDATLRLVMFEQGAEPGLFLIKQFWYLILFFPI
jgi:hypothetical protein